MDQIDYCGEVGDTDGMLNSFQEDTGISLFNNYYLFLSKLDILQFVKGSYY